MLTVDPGQRGSQLADSSWSFVPGGTRPLWLLAICDWLPRQTGAVRHLRHFDPHLRNTHTRRSLREQCSDPRWRVWAEGYLRLRPIPSPIGQILAPQLVLEVAELLRLDLEASQGRHPLPLLLQQQQALAVSVQQGELLQLPPALLRHRRPALGGQEVT